MANKRTTPIERMLNASPTTARANERNWFVTGLFIGNVRIHDRKIPPLLAVVLIEKTCQSIDKNDAGGPLFPHEYAGLSAHQRLNFVRLNRNARHQIQVSPSRTRMLFSRRMPKPSSRM